MDQLHGRIPAEALRTAMTRFNEAMNRSHYGRVVSLSEARLIEQDALMTVAILRRQINDQASPIYRLPPESLAMLASYLDNNDLFTATHVSCRWRATLHSFPTLWSNIQHGNHEEMLAMLEWSKSASLRVSIRFGSPPEDVMDTLCNNSARIVSLRSDDHAVLKRLLSRPMSSLKALSIRIFDELDASFDDQDPANEPAKAVPSLRVLVVGENISGLAFCVPHLTHFKFHGVYSQEMDGEMLSSILVVFRQCPMLEVVDVGWGEELYNFEDLDFTNLDAISLPHLRYLAQEQYVRIDQPWLPELLRLPQSCSIYLRKPPIHYDPYRVSPISLPFLRSGSPYIFDIRRVKLRTVHDRSEDAIVTFMEIVNGRGTLLSFRNTIIHGEVPRDQCAIIDDEINPCNLSALRSVNTGSPMVLCLDNYQMRGGEGEPTTYVAQGLYDLEKVTTLILSGSAVEPCLTVLEPDNRKNQQWCSTVHSLVIHTTSQLDFTGADVLQSLLRVAKKRKTAKAPFRSVTLAIPSTDLVVSPGELAALNEYIERFEFLAGDDALDWDVDKYFIPSYDPLQRRRDESAFEVDES